MENARDGDAVMVRPEHEDQQLTELIESLGPADAPPDLVDAVLARIAPQTRTAAAQPVVHQLARRSIPKRGVTVNKKMIFALAAAAVVVLAVIAYTSRPPATTGTEATIGTAQRAQAPQIAASDVQLGDTEAQEFFQSEVFDDLINDENTRTLLQDTSLRNILAEADVREALRDVAVREALRGGALKSMLAEHDLSRGLDAAYAKKIDDANARLALSNARVVGALKNSDVRLLFARSSFGGIISRQAVAKAVGRRTSGRARRGRRFDRPLARPAARRKPAGQLPPPGARQ